MDGNCSRYSKVHERTEPELTLSGEKSSDKHLHLNIQSLKIQCEKLELLVMIIQKTEKSSILEKLIRKFL